MMANSQRTRVCGAIQTTMDCDLWRYGRIELCRLLLKIFPDVASEQSATIIIDPDIRHLSNAERPGFNAAARARIELSAVYPNESA